MIMCAPPCICITSKIIQYFYCTSINLTPTLSHYIDHLRFYFLFEMGGTAVKLHGAVGVMIVSSFLYLQSLRTCTTGGNNLAEITREKSKRNRDKT